MSIRTKLIILFLAMAMFPLLIVSLVTFNSYKNSLEEVRLTQLADLAKVKSERLNDYFSRLKAEIEMAEYFYNVKKNLPILTQNVSDPKSKEFQSAKLMLDGQLTKTQNALNLNGVVLVDPEGKVVYTSDSKSSANYMFRPLPGPGQNAFTEGKKGIYISEIFFNAARAHDLEFIITAPVTDFNGAFIGVIAFEVDMDEINRLVQDNTGLGNTGETLLGKKDNKDVIFLTPLKYDPSAALKRKVLLGGVLGGPIQEAAQGKIGRGQLIDYRGIPVIAAWDPITNLNWGLVAKIDTDEASANAIYIRNLLYLIWGIVFVLGGLAAFYLARSISGPIKKLSEGAEIVGGGNLDCKVATNSKDEVGILSRSFDKMIKDLKRVMASRDELNKEINERKLVEVALRKSEERWSTTLSSIGDGVIATDTEGRITFINAVSERLTGWILAEAKNMPITEVFNIVNERTRKKVDNPADIALKTGTIVALANHTILIRKDRTEVPIDDSAAPIRDRDGKIFGSVLVFRDITDRKQADKAKNNFISVLAHELRNPLAPLLMAIQMLEMHARSKSEQEINPILFETTDIAFRQITNMTRLLDDLLDVSRIERGKIHLKIEKLDLANALELAVASAGSIINERGHTLSISLPTEPVVIEADPVRFEQIIVNLLNNAAKYTDRGGHIWLEASRVGIFAEIKVRDNGMGISPNKLPHIFEPFYQTEAALRRSHGGLGLGLMLVRTLLKMHKGSIEVISQGEGKGCEFIVRLPALPDGTALPAKANIVIPTPIVHVSEGKKKILVIEDNHSIAALMGDLLEHFGHDVITAHDGKSAIKLVGETKLDVVFCDIGLPGMDGYEVARVIRQMENGGRQLVLVAVTGFGQEEDRQNAFDAGFDHHLVKPVSIEALRSVIENNDT